jgi:hypothetical protein
MAKPTRGLIENSQLHYVQSVYKYVRDVLYSCILVCEEERAMPIGITDRIVALFAGLTREEVDMLPPVRRAQFAELCRHWANFAEIRPDAPRSGVLVELRTRRRDE